MGAVIGAGFISGQELLQFFLQFGRIGIISLFFSGLSLMVAGIFILKKTSELKLNTFNAFVNYLFGKKTALVATLVTTGYLIGGLIIMISGAGSVLSENFGIPLLLALIGSGVCMIVTIFFGTQGVIRANTILIPILIIFVTCISFITIYQNQIDLSQPIERLGRNPLLPNWFFAFLFYVSFNILGATAALSAIGRDISPERGIKGGIIGGIAITLLALFILLSLWANYPRILEYAIPTAYITGSINVAAQKIFAFVMWIAMFTTGLAYAFSFSKYLGEEFNKDFRRVSIVVVLLSVPFAGLGFAKLVGTVYPLFGLLGIFFLCFYPIKLIIDKLATIK